MNYVTVCPGEQSGYAVAYFRSVDAEAVEVGTIRVPDTGPSAVPDDADHVVVGSAIDLAVLRKRGVPLDARWVSIFALTSAAEWAKKTTVRIYNQKSMFTALDAKPIIKAAPTAEESTATMFLLAAQLMVQRNWLDLPENIEAYLSIERAFGLRLSEWSNATWEFNRSALEDSRRVIAAEGLENKARIERQLGVTLASEPTHHTVAQKIETRTGVTRPLNEHQELVWTDSTVRKMVADPEFGKVFECWFEWRRAHYFDGAARMILAASHPMTFDVYSPLPNGSAVAVPRLSKDLHVFAHGNTEVLEVQDYSLAGWMDLKKKLLEDPTITAVVPVERGFLVRHGETR